MVTLVLLVDRGAMASVLIIKCEIQLLLLLMLSGNVHDRRTEDSVTLKISRLTGGEGGSACTYKGLQKNQQQLAYKTWYTANFIAKAYPLMRM